MSHVYTHMGLLDAIARIDSARGQRVIGRAHAPLLRAGVPDPRIGVCGTSPLACPWRERGWTTGALDIAGKGVADECSLIEALRQAAELASRQVASRLVRVVGKNFYHW